MGIGLDRHTPDAKRIREVYSKFSFALWTGGQPMCALVSASNRS